MIPTHLTDGRLPEGVHSATWAEVADRFGFSPRRQMLLRGLFTALTHLHEGGCQRAWLAGSFVRTKVNPMDVDVVWDVTGVDPDDLDEMFLSPAGITVTKAMFGCEFFPSHIIESATMLPFLEFFQTMRDGSLCGVIEVDLDTL